MRVSFDLPTKPHPQLRGLIVRGRGRAHASMISHPDNVAYTDTIRFLARKQCSTAPTKKPLLLLLTFVMPKVSGMSKAQLKQIADGAFVFHTKRPDLSNLLKMFEDALKEHLFADDSQVVAVAMTKRYGSREGTIVTMLEIDDPEQLANFPRPDGDKVR